MLRATSILLVMLLCGSASQASAYHSDRKRTIIGTAFVLDQNEWMLGPFNADYGALEQLTVGTYLLPWFVVAPNLQLKLSLFQNEYWAVSLRPGMFFVNLELPRKIYGIGPQDADVKAWLFPIEGVVSLVIRHRFVLSALAVYTAVTGSGSYDPEDFQGTAAASNAQAGLDFQWRINHISALIFTARWVAYQGASGIGTSNVTVDDATTASVTASGTPRFADATNGYSFSASALFSWTTFNLRAGIGYGNYSVPGLNLVIPKLYPFPVFDVFWRF